MADKFKFMRALDVAYQALCDAYSTDLRTIGNRIPAGGAHMDNFFRSEGLRGVLTALRAGKSLTEAVAFGQSTAQIAIKLWNTRREWQVHRWLEAEDSYILRTVLRIYRQCK